MSSLTNKFMFFLIDLPCLIFIAQSQLEFNNTFQLAILLSSYLVLIALSFKLSILESQKFQRYQVLITLTKILVLSFCQKNLWVIYAFSVIFQGSLQKRKSYLNIGAFLFLATLLMLQSYMDEITGWAILDIIQVIICLQLTQANYTHKEPRHILQTLDVTQRNQLDSQPLFKEQMDWLTSEETIIIGQDLIPVYVNLFFEKYRKNSDSDSVCLTDFLQSTLTLQDTEISLDVKIKKMLEQKIHSIRFQQFNIRNEKLKLEGKIVQLYVNQSNQIIIHLIDDINYKQFEYNYLLDICKSLSHEFGTNLNCISLLIELTLQLNISAEFKKQYLIPIQTNVMQLEWILRNLRDYGAIESHELEPNLNSFNIKTQIIEIYSLFEAHLEEKGIQLKLQIFDYQITNDSDRFKQILYQIIQNAVRFGQQVIIIKVEKIYAGIQVEIIDDGCGMTELEQEKLNILLRQNRTIRVSQNSVGGGLGLLISNQLVKILNDDSSHEIVYKCSDGITSFIHSGDTIISLLKVSWCHFNQGNWQRPFNLIFQKNLHSKSLPQLSDSDEEQSKVIDMYSQLGQNHYKFSVLTQQSQIAVCCKRILIVDDEYFNIFALEKLLSQYGFICDAAFNGQQALNKLQQTNNKPCCQTCNNNKYCIIFLDINMPIMDGLETVKHIKQMEKNRIIDQVTCVANTAFTDRDTFERAFDAGMDYFITKPLNRTKLVNIITQILPDL